MKEPFFDCPTPGQACVIDHRLRRQQGDRRRGLRRRQHRPPATAAPPTASRSSPATPARARRAWAAPAPRCPRSAAATASSASPTASSATTATHRRRRLRAPTCRVEAGYTCADAGHGLHAGRALRRRPAGAGPRRDLRRRQHRPPATAAPRQCARRGQLRLPDARAGPASRTVVCGDGRVTGAETCDDGNTAAGDGCAATCAARDRLDLPGRAASAGPRAAATACCVGAEQCDDGNATTGDGCSAACMVESPGPTEPNGWICPTPGMPCTRTTCGDGMPEGSEQCDDGEQRHWATAARRSAARSRSARPAGGACTTSCGDGLLLPVDIAAGPAVRRRQHRRRRRLLGDLQGGDGLRLRDATPFTQDPLILPIVLPRLQGLRRDQRPPGLPARTAARETGIVQRMLGADGKPLHVAGQTRATHHQQQPGRDHRLLRACWYQDDADLQPDRAHDVLTVHRSWSTGELPVQQPTFFPLDGRGWGNYTGGTDADGASATTTSPPRSATGSSTRATRARLHRRRRRLGVRQQAAGGRPGRRARRPAAAASASTPATARGAGLRPAVSGCDAPPHGRLRA